jgi:hypothetical protein
LITNNSNANYRIMIIINGNREQNNNKHCYLDSDVNW